MNNFVNGIVNPNEFRDNMKKFIVDNGIIGTAAGVCIAVSTKDTIQSFVNDVIMPSIYFLLVSMNTSLFSKTLSTKHVIDIPKFAIQFVTWIFVCIITFIFIRVAFGTLFGVHNISKPDTTAVAAVAATTTKK